MRIKVSLNKEADDLQEGKEGLRCWSNDGHFEYNEEQIEALILADIGAENEEYRNVVYSVSIDSVIHD